MMISSDRPGTDISEVLGILADLTEADCSVWVAGGWGIDALVGRQTREHRDLDLAVDATDQPEVLAVLERRGYRIQTDWRPVRVEMVSDTRGWVDLHPVIFDSAGHGRQAAIGGGHFDYPLDAFGTGALGGLPVACLSSAQQRRFHQGYDLRAVDRHDLALLAELVTPPQRRPSST